MAQSQQTQDFLKQLIDLAADHLEAPGNEEGRIESKMLLLIYKFVKPFPTFDNPINYKKFRIYTSMTGFVKYEFSHEDYDGAPDAHDKRCGTANSIEEAIDQIIELNNEEE